MFPHEQEAHRHGLQRRLSLPPHPTLRIPQDQSISFENDPPRYLPARPRGRSNEEGAILPSVTSLLPLNGQENEASREFIPSLSGLSAFADPRLQETHSNRWSPYERRESLPYSEEAPNHRRRRIIPRRRLAALKARAHEVLTMENYETMRVPMLPVLYPLRPPSDSKTSRYLREMDRRLTLSRLDRGEKQSALAKEFRVTRVAICNLKEHRELVLSRQYGDPLAKYPKKTQPKDESRSNRISPDTPNVHKVALLSAERLFPLVSNRDTSDSAFRHYCDRLMTLVVEEMLAWTQYSNDTENSTLCGVSVAPEGSPMLSIFQTLEPDLPTGTIHHNLSQIDPPVADVIDLPSAVESHNVCLFYAFTDAVGGLRVAKSIRQLLDRGVVEELLCLVTLAVSTLTIGELQRAHPSQSVAAVHIERQEDDSQDNARLSLLASRAAAIY